MKNKKNADRKTSRKETNIADDIKETFRLDRDRYGRPKASVSTVLSVLKNHGWNNIIAYDEFTEQVVAVRNPPWGPLEAPAVIQKGPWTDHDDVRLTSWLSENYGINIKPQDAARAVEILARQSPFHPVRSYLTSLRWDRRKRIDRFFDRYFGSERSAYNSKVGRMALIAAIARVMKPGCKVDSMIVLEGSQGGYKSSAIRILAKNWHADSPIDLGHKDAFEAVRGVWLYEFAELDSFAKVASTRIKAFLTSAIDRFRPVYGKRAQSFPRQCIFWGTTNRDDYLHDESGNRRFLPVKCGRINLAALKHDLDQIWAEAFHAYQSGEHWWISSKRDVQLFKREQDARVHTDAWEEALQIYLGQKNVTMLMAAKTLGIEIDRLSHADQTRIGRIFTRLGLNKRRPSMNGKRTYVYDGQPG